MKRWGYRIHLDWGRFIFAFLYKKKGSGFSVAMGGPVIKWPFFSLKNSIRRARYKAVMEYRKKMRHERLLREFSS